MHKPELTRKFKRWWSGVCSHEPRKRNEIINQWLKYACKTVALRGNIDQQRVVYSINTRWRNSKYKKFRRYQAHTVYRIVNQHQQNYKALRKRWEEENNVQPRPVVVKKTRRIISSKRGGGNVRIG